MGPRPMAERLMGPRPIAPEIDGAGADGATVSEAHG